jgi:hypothetical protein
MRDMTLNQNNLPTLVSQVLLLKPDFLIHFVIFSRSVACRDSVSNAPQKTQSSQFDRHPGSASIVEFDSLSTIFGSPFHCLFR